MAKIVQRVEKLVNPTYWKYFRMIALEKIMKTTCNESVLDQYLKLYHSPVSQNNISHNHLRILYCAQKNDYGYPSRGLSIEENFFFHTFYENGFEIIRFDPMDILKKVGQKNMNDMLLEAAYRYSPDILFCSLFKDEIDKGTIDEITRSNRVLTLNWFSDDQWRFETFSKDWIPCFSWGITTSKAAYEKYINAGNKNIILSQWGCNHRLYFKMDTSKIFDLSFIGLPHGDRRDVIRSLRKSGLKVDIWGFGWEGGRISQYQMIKIFNQSLVNLNLNNASVNAIQQIKARNFEIPGCHGFLLTGRAENLEEYFEIDKEIVCFSGIEELIDKAKYYLNHQSEMEYIAHNGYLRTLHDHTYDNRFRQIFNKIGM